MQNKVHRFFQHLGFKIRRCFIKNIKPQEAQDIIYDLLANDKPCFIGRFGSVEIQGTINGLLTFPLYYLFKNRIYSHLIKNAGFFPVDRKNVKKFARLMVKSMQECDCLASWRVEEILFKHKLKKANKVGLQSLMPTGPELNVDYKWGKALEGKKVLVISPFKELIEHQYLNNREKIWKNPNILPEFKELHTLKSVNSVGGTQNCDFDTWFDALEDMQQKISQIDFDIAILGCGAYGFPLAAYIKSIGKKAIHVGGATQLIFGIKGKRWEKATFINEHWVSPRIEDRPKGWESVEGGCYW